MTTQDVSNHSAGWLSIREASLRLSISELTVRRRIKDGKLRSKLEGGKYYVLLTDAPDPLQEAHQEPVRAAEPARAEVETAVPAAPPFDVSRLLADHSRLAEQAGRAGLLEEQLRSLQQQYAALQEGAMALANRNGWLESKLDEREREIKLLEDSRQRPSWWRRIFLGA